MVLIKDYIAISFSSGHLASVWQCLHFLQFAFLLFLLFVFRKGTSQDTLTKFLVWLK